MNVKFCTMHVKILYMKPNGYFKSSQAAAGYHIYEYQTLFKNYKKIKYLEFSSKETVYSLKSIYSICNTV